MHLLDLPKELLDLIFDFLLASPEHPHSTRNTPRLNWHAHPHNLLLLPLRLTNRFFASELTPPLFAHITSKSPSARHDQISALSKSPTLTPLVHTLRIDLAPCDWGRAWSDKIHGYPPRDRPIAYFEDLADFLTPLLARFQALRILHVTTTYAGLHLAGISRGQLLMPCFECLCRIVTEARLLKLEEVQIGVPYEGGYAGFFQDQGMVGRAEGMSECLRSASVKLSDWQDNFTIMPIL